MRARTQVADGDEIGVGHSDPNLNVPLLNDSRWGESSRQPRVGSRKPKAEKREEFPFRDVGVDPLFFPKSVQPADVVAVVRSMVFGVGKLLHARRLRRPQVALYIRFGESGLRDGVDLETAGKMPALRAAAFGDTAWYRRPTISSGKLRESFWLIRRVRPEWKSRRHLPRARFRSLILDKEPAD